MLKAVLFDMDDTLLDWSGFKTEWAIMERKHLAKVLDYLSDFHPINDYDAYMREVRQRTVAAWTAARDDMRSPNLGTLLVDAAIAMGVPLEHLDVRRLLEAYQWGAIEGTVLFPDVPLLLKLLHDHNIKVGIVTNAYQPMWLRELELRDLEVLDFFPDCRLSAADVGYLKPHPVIFQTALDCLGTTSEQTVFVGDDLEADIAGAKSAGMRAVLRLTHRNRDVETGIIPDAKITTFEELPALFDEWYPGWRAENGNA
jgi:HAD superfamily hydrolase (TIGR01509 family)